MNEGKVSTRRLKERKFAILQEQMRRNQRRRLFTYFPDTGALRRELYKKHLAFFRAGGCHRIRAFMAANRIGKTESGGGYETTLHLTGRYPDWWEGRRFDRPVNVWAAGDTSQTTRDTCQRKLLGKLEELGTGLLPGEDIIDLKRKAGNVPDCIETVYVRHVSGGISRLGFKSYDQGRKAFQGTEQDVVWMDEEPPMAVYQECLLRTMTTDGLLILTFTPLEGLSEVVLAFLPGGTIPANSDDTVITGGKYLISATWDDVPHLTEEAKAELLAEIPPFQRDARSKGIPQLGAGAIYPMPEEDYKVTPFDIPEHWPRGYALDVGWNNTAALWGALDRETDTLFIYDEYKRSHAEPEVHAASIKQRGDWMTGAVDPASKGRSQKDGEKLFDEYRDLGLNLVTAENAVEAGILKVWRRLSTGRLKVFSTCTKFFEEIRLYRRDEKGQIVKANDHLMDDLRYINATPIALNTQPDPDAQGWRPKRRRR